MYGIGTPMLAGAHSKLKRAFRHWHRGQIRVLTRRNARTRRDGDGGRGAEKERERVREKEKETETDIKAQCAHRELNPGPP